MSKLKSKTIKDLIPIFGQKIESQDGVNARDLWCFLEVKDKFANWIQRSIKKNDFVEGIDYVRFPDSGSERRIGSEHKIEYYVSLDMAKHLGMLQSTQKGKEIRNYFLDCEKIAKAAIENAFRQRERQITKEWKQAREDGKVPRRTTTDALQEFEKYAEEQGSQNAHWYYKAGTCLVYNACVDGGWKEVQRRMKEMGKENGRDVLTMEELMRVWRLELDCLPHTVTEIKGKKEEYHIGFNLLKEKMMQYGEIIRRHDRLLN